MSKKMTLMQHRKDLLSVIVNKEDYTLNLSSKRDNYYCLQPFTHSFRKIGAFLPVNVFINSDSSANTNTSNTLTIPISLNVDTRHLCAILTGRADSGLTVPFGWSLIRSESIISSAGLLTSMKYWILTKEYNGDTSASFDLNRAANQGVVISLKSDVVNSFSSLNSNTLNATK